MKIHHLTPFLETYGSKEKEDSASREQTKKKQKQPQF
jgi:hypothetical protein